MSTINIDLAADTILNVMIGQQDENEVREVVFDFSGWYTTYGSGTISLAIQRAKDEWPYEGTLTVDSTNHKATWEISETDTAYAGTGQIQLSYKVGDAKKKSVVYRFTCHKSLGALGSVVTPVQIQTFIDEVEEALQTMDGKLDDMEDEITDVKADLQDLIEHGTGSTVSSEVRQAILALFEAAAYAETDLDDYIAVIESWASQVTAITLNQSSISISGSGTYQLIATTTPSGGTVTWSSSNTAVATVSSNGLVTSVSNGTAVITATSGDASATCTVTISGFATLTSISAVYTQSGTVYDTDTLDSLKTDLVVTAHWDVGADTTVSSTDYTLSGTLTEGTSTITVSYGGKTTTFDVIVVHTELPVGYTKYDYITQNVAFNAFIKNYGIHTNAQIKTDYTIEAKMYLPSGLGSSANATNILGTRIGSGGTKEFGLFYRYNDARIGYWYDGTDTTTTNIYMSKNQVNTVKVQPVGKSQTYPNNATINVNGADYSTGSTSTEKTFSPWFGLLSYAISASSTATTDFYYGGLQLGEVVVYDSNNDVVYDFVPAKDSDDKYGFYEKVNGTFYYNATYATTGYIGGYWE